MLGSAIFDRVCAAARRFARAKDGNVAVIFTLAILPIFAFIGAAIDYTRANNARTAMQSALDSAALMLSKDLTMGNITAAQIPSKAQSYFSALYTNKDGQGISVSATYTTPTSSAAATILLGGTGYIKSDFMQLAGFPTLNFSSSSTTTWGNVKMRVALALDNTGSMSQNGKITALRNAVAGSGGLIDQLSALSKTNGDVYISVIPFAKVVNLSASNYSQSYIDWTDWLNPPTAQPAIPSSMAASLPMNWHAVGPGAQCPWSNSSGGFYCTTGPTNGAGRSPNNYSTNTIPSSGTYSGYICPSVDYNTHTMYNGCWVSTQVGTTAQTFCSGSSSCACPLDANYNNVSGCSCSGTGTGKSCTGLIYTHNWTQPGPNDTADNPGQPRVSAVVGWTNNKWTSTNQTPTVQNDWRAASTNPITTWTGCITDRTQPNDATGVLPTSSDVTTLFPRQPVLREQLGLLRRQRLAAARADHSPDLQLERAEDRRQRHAADRRHRPIGRPGVGLAVPSGGRSAEHAGGRLQHDLQPGHHPAVRRSEHRGPLAQLWRRQLAGLRQSDRCPAGAAVSESAEREGCQRCTDVHHLHDPGEHEHARRPDLDRAEELRQQPRQILHADQLEPNRDDVQHDRHRAQQAAAGEVASAPGI
ncbi:TadE/TadG family type IV pilus assembly protein [Bradyrhizobium sp. USDA 4473]